MALQLFRKSCNFLEKFAIRCITFITRKIHVTLICPVKSFVAQWVFLGGGGCCCVVVLGVVFFNFAFSYISFLGWHVLYLFLGYFINLGVMGYLSILINVDKSTL